MTRKRDARKCQFDDGSNVVGVVMFIDLSGSTEFKARHPIPEGINRVVDFNMEVTKLVLGRSTRQYAGRHIAKYIGDEVMVYFTGSSAAKNACLTAVKIQKHFHKFNENISDPEKRFHAKIGLDYGHFSLQRYPRFPQRDPHGLAVDRAARIVALAKPSQILLSEEVMAAARITAKIQFSAAARRQLRGISRPVSIRELVLTKPAAGIREAESYVIPTIDADAATVYNFIRQQNLLENSTCIDLYLFTFETLTTDIKQDLQERKKKITFRVLMCNPKSNERYKERHREKIKISLSSMASIMAKNKQVSFHVRFYNYPPTFRSFIFHLPNHKGVGLLGVYQWEKNFSAEYEFVGAESNKLLRVREEDPNEKHFLELYQSRFDYCWDELTVPRAVIFDLDGVLIDSMEFYFESYRRALESSGVLVERTFVYLREGEKIEETLKAAFSQSCKEVPNATTVTMTAKRVLKEYESQFSVRFMEGASDLLDALEKHGVHLALVTGSRSLERKFQNHPDFLKRFAVSVKGDDTQRGKPYADPYEKAVERLRASNKKIDKQHCCVVENAPLGIRAAVAAGLACFAVKGNSPLEDKEFTNAGALATYANLTELMEKILLWADVNIPFREFLEVLPS